MKRSFPRFLLLTSFMLWFAPDAGSEPPAPTTVLSSGVYQADSVDPANFILHGIEMSTQFHPDRSYVSLRGPRMFSHPVSVATEKSINPTHQIWYQIAKPQSAANQSIEVSAPFSTDTTWTIALGETAYVAAPAQWITSGPPAEVPGDLNYFIAYQIMQIDCSDGGSPKPSGKLAELSELSKVTLSVPKWIAVPASRWHHDEHSPVLDGNRYQLIYPVNSPTAIRDINVIDQFGLNRLKTKETSWWVVDVRSSSNKR